MRRAGPGLTFCRSLHECQFLTAPGDEGMLTDMGTFVAQLGVDLLLGRLVGLASMFGCLPEVSGGGLTATATSAFSLL